MDSHCIGAACEDASDHRLTRETVEYACKRSAGTEMCEKSLRIIYACLRISTNAGCLYAFVEIRRHAYLPTQETVFEYTRTPTDRSVGRGIRTGRSDAVAVH